MYLSKTKKSECGYCSKEMLDDIFKALLQGGARKGKVTARPKNVDFQYDSRRTSKKKAKSDIAENLNLAIVLFN